MRHSASLAAVTAMLFAGAASAADLPSRKSAPVYVPAPPLISWTGFYGGLNIGGGWVDGGNTANLAYADPAFPVLAAPAGFTTPNLFLLPGATTGTSAGVVGGGQIGFNYQFGTSFLIGVEADMQGTSMSAGSGSNLTAFPSPYAATNLLLPLAGSAGGNLGLPWFGTVRGRIGYLVTPSLLVYGTGGFAYGGAEAFGYSATLTGWTAGGGVEWMFMPNWSAKLEYLHAEFGSGDFNNGSWGWGAGLQGNLQLNLVRAGINYHFNWGAPAAILAKY
jgi:outer membrane immunogenic protein